MNDNESDKIIKMRKLIKSKKICEMVSSRFAGAKSKANSAWIVSVSKAPFGETEHKSVSSKPAIKINETSYKSKSNKSYYCRNIQKRRKKLHRVALIFKS